MHKVNDNRMAGHLEMVFIMKLFIFNERRT